METKKPSKYKRYYDNIKKHPERYAKYLKVRRANKVKKFHSLNESQKNEIRIQKAKEQKEYIQRKQEKDPKFEQHFRTKVLREQVYKGIATKEDLEKYEDLKMKQAIRSRESRKRKRERKERENN